MDARRSGRTVLIEVYEGNHLVHNALCRTLMDVAVASQGREFRLIPPKDSGQVLEWDGDYDYDSHDNFIALGGQD